MLARLAAPSPLGRARHDEGAQAAPDKDVWPARSPALLCAGRRGRADRTPLRGVAEASRPSRPCTTGGRAPRGRRPRISERRSRVLRRLRRASRAGASPGNTWQNRPIGRECQGRHAEQDYKSAALAIVELALLWRHGRQDKVVGHQGALDQRRINPTKRSDIVGPIVGARGKRTDSLR